jgi:hypothetical protein
MLGTGLKLSSLDFLFFYNLAVISDKTYYLFLLSPTKLIGNILSLLLIIYTAMYWCSKHLKKNPQNPNIGAVCSHFFA